MIRIGVIGCGQWGPNHIRNFSNLEGSKVVACSDLSTDRLRAMSSLVRHIKTTRDYRDILSNPDIDAVAISTPAALHYKIAKESLLAGKDVLCEKPLCTKMSDALELTRLAKSRKKILMVGHVFVFNPGIQKLRELIHKKKGGRIYYLHSERTNLGPFRRDVNAVWDLACHDVYIFNYLLNAQPIEVSARGGQYLQKKIEDVAFISMTYPKGVLVNIHVSWLDPKKVRQITVVGNKSMITWDDLDNVGPIKIYDRQVVQKYYYETFGEFTLLAKEGDITIPKIDLKEPLKIQDAHFLDCVQRRIQPVPDGMAGVQTVKVLEAIQKSLAKRGNPVRVS